jgi:hypothetical protein
MTPEPTIRELIARSSFGGDAWCAGCKHADILHENQGCIALGYLDGTDTVACGCPKLRRMTPEEWLTDKGET